MTYLRVSEHFYSIQGEGPTVGVPAVFLRLQGCNLNCGAKGGDWTCDTETVWKNGTKFKTTEFFKMFYGLYEEPFKQGAHLVITGGEPLIQQKSLTDFIHQFPSKPTIEVETNGTILPETSFAKLIDQWNVSPKLSNSGESMNQRFKNDTLLWFSASPKAIFKFVVSKESDLKEIENDFKWVIKLPIRQKFLMPAIDNKSNLDAAYKPVIEWSKQLGFSLSQRFHIEMWNQTTGV